VQDTGEENTKKAFGASLHRLGLDYLDLYLIHQPYGAYYGSWRAMRALNEQGTVKPSASPTSTPTGSWTLSTAPGPLRRSTRSRPTPTSSGSPTTTSWPGGGSSTSPGGGFAEGRNNLFSDPTLTEIGAAHGKSIAQVVLRWLTQRNIVAIPKSVHPERMAQNLDVSDFTLTDDEMARIAAMDTGATLFSTIATPPWSAPSKPPYPRLTTHPHSHPRRAPLAGRSRRGTRAARPRRRPDHPTSLALLREAYQQSGDRARADHLVRALRR
jgi:2,5-diketo-D-gluconate reductase A